MILDTVCPIKSVTLQTYSPSNPKTIGPRDNIGVSSPLTVQPSLQGTISHSYVRPNPDAVQLSVTFRPMETLRSSRSSITGGGTRERTIRLNIMKKGIRRERGGVGDGGEKARECNSK